MLQHRAKVAEKVGAKILEIVKKMGTKNLQNGSPNRPKSSPEGAKRGPGRPKNRKKKLTHQKTPIPQLASPIFEGKSGQHGSKLASKMDPKSKKNRWKIDGKCDASWNRFLEGFYGIYKRKMEAY